MQFLIQTNTSDEFLPPARFLYLELTPEDAADIVARIDQARERVARAPARPHREFFTVEWGYDSLPWLEELPPAYRHYADALHDGTTILALPEPLDLATPRDSDGVWRLHGTEPTGLPVVPTEFTQLSVALWQVYFSTYLEDDGPRVVSEWIPCELFQAVAEGRVPREVALILADPEGDRTTP